MNTKLLMSAACAALTMIGLAQTANALDFRGGARTSVNTTAREGNRQNNMTQREGNRQSANETNVATRQANMTTRQSNRQNTISNVSNNRQNTISNVSNNRQTTINNINNNYHHDDWYEDHPVATAAAVTAAVGVTAAVVGSIVHSIPPSCSAVIVNGVTYQQCGSSWYQPQYAGTSVQYVVINPPR